MASNAGIAKNVVIISKDSRKSIVAGETIQKDELIGAAVGSIVRSTKSRYAFRLGSGRGKNVKIIVENKFRHMQESETPNVRCENGLFFASEKIRKNKPLTIASKL